MTTRTAPPGTNGTHKQTTHKGGHKSGGRTARTATVLDPALRALRCEVARWALNTGRPLNLDAVTVILAARHAEAVAEGRPFNRWTTNSVLTFLFGTADEWCHRQRVPSPPHLGESLLTYITFLAEAGVLASGSSTARQLHNTISDLAGLTSSGHRRPTPNGGGDITVPTPLRPSAS